MPTTSAAGTLSLHADGEFMIKARPLALRRAMNNLIDNARTVTRASLQASSLRLRRSVAAIIEVLDAWPEFHQRRSSGSSVRSTRLETARTDARGSGLGLAIVDRIARGHGGGAAASKQRDGGAFRR